MDGASPLFRADTLVGANPLFRIHPAGLEPAPFGSVDRGKTHDLQGYSPVVAPMVATEIADNGCKQLISAPPLDPGLARIVAVWPNLSPTAKRMILAALESDQGEPP